MSTEAQRGRSCFAVAYREQATYLSAAAGLMGCSEDKKLLPK